MWFVYILKSDNYKKSYVGCTNDLDRRLHEHNKGKSLHTRRFKPWVLLKSENFSTYREARERERFYKSGVGRQELRQIFNHSGVV